MLRYCSTVFLLLFLSVGSSLSAQTLTQTIRGKITDKEARYPLVGVVVVLTGDEQSNTGAVTDAEGHYRLEKVPVGRHVITVSYTGYKQRIISNLQVSSAKELILDIEMEEDIAVLGQVEITAEKKGGLNNEMSTVSARSFNVEETERYAGSRGDPARMASNFAGVQGSDDSRNDIVVRGNSPFGVLYRIEGVDAPNPNHFAVAGTSGGPVSILNNKILANSDFFTGAFPAEYGNSTAGVFDIRLRNGNNEKREFTGQFGFLGTELTAEGPLGKAGASYLVNYRYSTLKIFESLNLKIGTSAVPNYQDAAFKINLPVQKGTIGLFAIGGASNIDIIVSNRTRQEDEIYGEKDRDQYFGSSMGLAGVTYARNHGAATYGKLTAAISGSKVYAHHDKAYFNTSFQLDSLKRILGYNFLQGKQMIAYALNHKMNTRHSLKAGLLAERLTVNLIDTVFNSMVQRFVNRADAIDATFFIQPYIQWKWRAGEHITINSGLHAQYFALNRSTAIEPRVGLRWDISNRSAFSLGYGLHSQMQPLYIYYHHIEEGNGYRRHNQDIGFTRSHHIVAGYDQALGTRLRFKSEVYYQYLFDVPVEKQRSAFSLINQGTGFTRLFPNELENKGIGRNYGLELTLERSFSRSYFFMISAAVFQSEYQGSDAIWRNTDFNTNFASNLLIGKEWKVSEKSLIQVGSKTTFAGGRRYGPADEAASAVTGEVIYIDSLTNSRQFKDYFRTDIKLNYKSNRPKVSHEIGLDLVNVLNTKNLLTLTYAPNPARPQDNPIREEYQLGFLPLFYYKIDF